MSVAYRCLFVFVLAITLSQQAQCRPVHICFVQSSKLFTEEVELSGATLRESARAELYDFQTAPIGESTIAIIGRNARTGDMYIANGSNVLAVARDRATVVLSNAADPAVSPDGNYIAFDRGQAVYVADTKSFSIKRLTIAGSEPCWALNGKEIACISNSATDADAPAFVMDSKTGKIIFRGERLGFLDTPSLSPDGHYLAAVCSISRPVQGDTVWCDPKESAAPLVDDISMYTPAKFLPGIIKDWSTDGKWIVWEWRTPDPTNDGSWLGDDIGLTSADGRVRQRIDVGQFAHFSPDGRLIFYLKPRFPKAVARQGGPFVLMLAGRTTSERRIIESGVSSYIVY